MNKQTITFLAVLIVLAGTGGYVLLQNSGFFRSQSPVATQAHIEPNARSWSGSPFGAHGAFSRPFIESDEVAVEEVLQRVSREKVPYRHVQDLGIRWVRPGVDIYWKVVQPTQGYIENGLFEWRTLDDLYGRVPSGVNILGTIDALPWGVNTDPAFKPGTWEFAGKDEESYYVRFVRAVVERYDGDGYRDMPGLKNAIKHWQIGNEPAARPSFGIGDIDLKFDWAGFGHLVEVSYAAVKYSDPEAKVVLAGMASGYSGGNDPLAKRELEEFYFPLLRDLRGRYIDAFDIHYYGSMQRDLEGLPEGWQWKGMGDIYGVVRQALDQNGYKNAEIWFTETAVPSNPFGERFQAISLVKRYVYPLSLGVKKVFWWNVVEGEYPLEVDKPNNHFGLVYDGIGKKDPGYGVEKLAYYTYKKLIETLEGSDWNSVQTVEESDGVYVYRFTKQQGKYLWVAWNENAAETQVAVYGITSHQVKITEAVPRYASGKEVGDYNTAFNTVTKTVLGGKASITLGEVPVFVEAD